ncbi:hypothetical protein CDN99_21435 [Roseateles aquatilis]|uniref:DUF1090 domain-containing protein n=1 Tax=Roseateles aquatilis TaxID=431061 RepID=A0A246IZ65_9BURK|nr:DUF1090 domain-containing protein [Roseateles aquatilis]OWQ85650.1 hypothetical protein CDN99_21435 [Roseateles aquatilis]
MKRPPPVLLLLALAAPAFAAEPGPACAAKRASIETQITEAKAHGNKPQLAGLERALRATKAHCTDEGLAREREARIRKAQKEVTAREADLAKEQQDGNEKKIAKRSAKLDAAQRELEEAQKPLER